MTSKILHSEILSQWEYGQFSNPHLHYHLLEWSLLSFTETILLPFDDTLDELQTSSMVLGYTALP